MNEGECWACGEPHVVRQTFSMEIKEKVDGRPGGFGWFAVTLCLDCQSIVKRLLEQIRVARYRQAPS